VHLGVVQDDKAGVAEEVSPDEVVGRRVAELIDDEIVRMAPMRRDELVGGVVGVKVKCPKAPAQ
jgi:hypothetical protein